MEFLSRSEIAERVVAIGRSAHAVQEDIHLAACSILKHTLDHGDYTAGELLLNALPRGQRVKALAFWFSHFSSKMLTFKVDQDTNLWVGKLDKKREDSDFKIDAACETTFADLTNEVEPKSVTVETLLKAMKSKATNTDVNSNGTPKVTPEARAMASKVVAFIRQQMIEAKAA